MRSVILLIALGVCTLCSTPAYAQKSEERARTERKAAVLFWSGISVAGIGVPFIMGGTSSVGVPFVAAGGGMIYYGVHLNRKSKMMASTTFGVMPVKKGVGFAVSRSW